MIKCLVKELRALLVEQRVIVDDNAGVLLFLHDNLCAEEFLVKQLVTDTDNTFSDEDSLKDLLVLILHNLIFLVESWLKDPDEIANETSDALGLESLSQLLLLERLQGLEVESVPIKKIIPQVVNDDF